MQYIADGPESSPDVFVFAHGAGGAMDTPFMTEVARGLAARGIRVVRFEFPYMAARRQGKKSGAPDRAPVLLEAFRQVIDHHGGGERVFIGGKSMGGRMATMIADQARVRGVVVFGYPFHPPGKPQQLRTEHLQSMRTPTLIVQGSRDTFGTELEVRHYALSKAIAIEWIAGGDHSLKGGRKDIHNLPHAIDVAASFIREERLPSSG